MVFIRGNLLLPYQFWFPCSKLGQGGRMFFIFFIFLNLCWCCCFLSLLLNCFFPSIFLLLLFWLVLSSITFVNVCISLSCPLIFFLCYRIKINSPILCQLFWPTSYMWQRLLEMFLKFTILSFILEAESKIHEKCGTMGVRL